MWKEIAPKQLKGNPFEMIADEYMLIAAGNAEKFNMMTASWGFLGEMWGKECAVAMIRPQRYTLEFVEQNDFFSLSFYGENKAVHKICGSKSGRDTDKAKEAGLTPVFSDGTVYFEEARLVLVCKKLYHQDLKPECFTDSEPEVKWYPQKDYHRMFIGEIVKVLVKGE